MVRGKRGWIRIVEAFVAVLIVAGALLMVVDQQSSDKSGFSQEIYEQQIKVLRAIELDATARDAILTHKLGVRGTSSNDATFPAVILGELTTRIPASLDCEAMICALEKICVQETYSEVEVYAASVAIVADGDTYSPKQLKLFCSIK